MGFDIKQVTSMLGIAGKFALEQSLKAASRDMACRDRCAREMFECENVNQVWPPRDTATRIMWEQRAGNAILGLQKLISGQ